MEFQSDDKKGLSCLSLFLIQVTIVNPLIMLWLQFIHILGKPTLKLFIYLSLPKSLKKMKEANKSMNYCEFR